VNQLIGRRTRPGRSFEPDPDLRAGLHAGSTRLRAVDLRLVVAAAIFVVVFAC